MQTRQVHATAAAKKTAQVKTQSQSATKKATEPKPEAKAKKTKNDRYEATLETGSNPFRPGSRRAYFFDLLASAKSPGLSIATIEQRLKQAKKETKVSTLRSWVGSLRRHKLPLIEENGGYRLETKKQSAKAKGKQRFVETEPETFISVEAQEKGGKK